MKRIFCNALTALLLLALPLAAAAQQDSRHTREATKFMGLAMTRQDDAGRLEMFEQALVHIREGMEKEPGNAKVWLLGGTLLAITGEYDEADRAFTKALELHPAYAADVRDARHEAWVEAFNAGARAMDAQDYVDATRKLEAAQTLFDERPEALMNLGLLYAHAGDMAKAETALKGVVAATHGPMLQELTEEERAPWLEFRETAPITLASLWMGEGIEAFQAAKYDEALAAFMKSAEYNPRSRDALFNQAQSLWAQASLIEDSIADDAPAAESRSAWQRAAAIYGRAEPLITATRALDPNSEALLVIESAMHRARANAAETAEETKVHADRQLKVLETHQALPFDLDGIAVLADGTGQKLVGKLNNRTLAQGAPVVIRFTFVGLDGRALGEQAVEVSAPAVDSVVEFNQPVTVSGQIAGWKYTIGG